MRKPILAGAALLALAAAVTSSAMASDHKPGRHGSQVGRAYVNGTHSVRVRHTSRFASEGGWENGNAYGYGQARSLGPLGITFGCVHGYCGQGFSVSAWSR